MAEKAQKTAEKAENPIGKMIATLYWIEYLYVFSCILE